jgi:fatty-acyl-CoA synthase
MIRTDWLARHALYTPDADALVWAPTGEALTYADCHEQGQRLAAWLAAEHGLRKGDRVAVLAQNTLEHVLLFIAAQKAGFILVPLNFRLAQPELQYLVEDSDPAVLFFSEKYADTARALDTGAPRHPLAQVRAAGGEDGGENGSEEHAADMPAAECDLDDPLMILYTSGTTGRPKGAILTHGMLFFNSVNTEMRLDLTARDASFNAAPFYHTGGWNVLLTPFLHHGARTVLFEDFDADAILRRCDDEALTILWGVPTMLKMMAESEAFGEVSLDSVRYAIVGGEAMPEPLIRTWEKKGVPIRQGFGMTEVGVNCFSLPERDATRKIGSIGLPNFYLDARVVDEDGADVPQGEPGELWMRGPVVTPGYWRDPDATADAFAEGGWFRTGDLVRQDEEGYFYVVGRKKEMYVSGGENVYPAEVEAALYAHDAVAEAAVVGVPDERWGEAGVAFISTKNGQSLAFEDVRAHCRTRLAGYKVPRDVRVLEALPKGHSGKIQKNALRERL